MTIAPLNQPFMIYFIKTFPRFYFESEFTHFYLHLGSIDDQLEKKKR